MNENRDVLDLLFPDRAPDCEWAIRWEDACDIVTAHVADRYPTATLVAIFGSVAASRQTSLSDIDVLLIVEEARGHLREQIVVQGRMLQIMVMSSAMAVAQINSYTMAGNGFLAGIILESRFVRGDRALLDLLKRCSASASAMLVEAGLKKSGVGIASRIANTIIALCRCRDEADRIFLVEQLASRFREFILTSHGLFGGPGLSANRLVADKLGQHNEIFSALYLSSMRGDGVEGLCQFIWTYVQRYGYRGWETQNAIPY